MLDDTDRRILSVLQHDARASMRRISEKAGVSLGTVSNRVRRLEASGAIRGYTVMLDPEKVGWELTVVIGLRIQKGRLIEIQDRGIVGKTGASWRFRRKHFFNDRGWRFHVPETVFGKLLVQLDAK